VKSSSGKILPREQALYFILGTIMNQTDYRSMQATSARSSVLGAVKSVKSYNKSLVDYHKNPSKYKGEPRFPKYKGSYSMNRNDGRYIFAIGNFKVNKKTGTITVNGTYELDSVYIDDSLGEVKQIRIVPKPTMGMCVVEVVYENKTENTNNSHNVMGIDIGVNNLAAITITDISGNVIYSEIVDGKPLKSINQYFNKETAKTKSEYCGNGNFMWKKVKNKNGKVEDVKIALSGKKLKTLSRKRYNKIETYMHTMSKHVIDVAKTHHVGHIFVGHNDNWKQNCNMGCFGNQRFVCIPFNRFISMLEYKGNNAGIVVTQIKEDYTSKCSALDGEEICKHEKYMGIRRKGKRCKEFVTSDGILVNADINGSLNILRRGLDILTGEKNSKIKPNQTIFVPRRYNNTMTKEKNATQSFSAEIPENMYGKSEETKISLKSEATVDSHKDTKLPLEEHIGLDSECQLS